MGLDKVVEWIEFSPIGYVVTGVNSFTAFKNFQRFSEGGDIGDLALGVGSTLLVGVGVYFLGKHAKIKRRIEEGFEKKGYDERLIKPYLHTWCDRNVARVVSKKFGFSDEFKDTLKKYDLHWYDVMPRSDI